MNDVHYWTPRETKRVQIKLVYCSLVCFALKLVFLYTVPSTTRKEYILNELNVIQLYCNPHGFRMSIKFSIDF